MNPPFQLDSDGISELQVLWEDGERVFCRGWRADGGRGAALVVLPAGERPTPAALEHLAHEYELRDELDAEWAALPLALARVGGRTALLLEDPGGEPLERLIDGPMEADRFLGVAMGIAAALGKAHQRNLVHKDVKPVNILVNCADGRTRFTGFGIASRLREHQGPEPPEFIAGTLAYMAPEQTGRMNRSIDSRSDLYALGVTFYRMVTGRLPFSAADPMEWVHCHIARTPVPPAERLASVPPAISEIVMKLLAKTAEARYQTAAGLGHDLRRCLRAWERDGRIELFALGEHDESDRLVLPEKLYGREREIETVLAAFDRVAAGGAPELVLVAGQAGVGKSAVAHELHSALVARRGLFASGKFDQLKRDIPYASLAQALTELIRSLLGKSEADLAPWRAEIATALEPNGALFVTLLPDLELLVGPLPPAPELSPRDARLRFQLVFQRLLGVFARPEHPLALFLDDLQWLDASTLDLLEDLLSEPDLHHLLLIGAYRDDEVTPEHPLMRRLAAVSEAGGRVSRIELKPLALEDVGRIVADALRSDRCRPLTRLVHEKTAGNPFFVIQFLTALAEEGLLAFERDAARWTWDLRQIRAKGYTDNVVDLMLGKLRRLPAAVRAVVKQLACLGASAPVTTLALLQGGGDDALHAALWPAVRARLLVRQEGAYRFLHDRVREAAYALIPGGERAAAHLAIGRRLVTRTPPEAVEERAFEIVGQLNRGSALIRSGKERLRLAALNLLAGRRARSSTAHASALTYFTAGADLLPADLWEHHHDLGFALELNRAECEFLTGALTEAEARLAGLSVRATSPSEMATVTRLRVDLSMTLGRSDRAVAVGLECLGRFGVDWAEHPTRDEVKDEYAQLWRWLGDRPVEALIDLPPMTDPVARATIDVLTSLVTPALYTDENLRCLVIGRMGNLCLEHGDSDASCYAYASVGNVLSLTFGDYAAGFRFAELGLNLVERSGMDRLRARVYLAFGNLAKPSPRHDWAGRPIAQRAFEIALRAGDLTYAGYSCNNILIQLLASGAPLAHAQREAEARLDFARRARFDVIVAFLTVQLGLIRTLRGLTPVFGCLTDDGFDEARFERSLEAGPSLGGAVCMYWIRKLQARVLAGDHVAALAAAAMSERHLWMTHAFFERADYHLYAALALTALCETASDAERSQYRVAVAAHHRQLQAWAEHCPANFASHAALVGAETTRLEGRELDAERLYEQAIRSARGNGLIHHEALAYELAARFHEARGFEELAHLYLGNARHLYLRWGADAKARQLDQLHPRLRRDERAAGATGTIEAPVEHLDLATIIEVSQALSAEMVLEKLIDRLMRAAIEHAGAERGLLIYPRGEELQIDAEATARGENVTVHVRERGADFAAALPDSIIRYAIRTRDTVIVDDALSQNPFSADPYIAQRRARSILCLPLINHGKLVGVLYLENDLTPHIFTPGRITVLKVLAAQVAISLENTRLYRDLEDRERKIRRLVEANIIGILVADLEGRVVEANDAFFRIIGYDRDDLVSGRVRWTDLTPPEWREHDARMLAELNSTGTAQPFEKEYFRKDGSRVPVLIGCALFEEGGDEAVAFVLDLAERKRAEEALRELESDFARMNRVSMVGELAASLAHEITQPIASARNNARAAQNFLDMRPPDLGEVSEALAGVVGDTDRAGDIIDRIREHIRKAPSRKEHFALNTAINEVIVLARSVINRNGVSVQARLADGLLPVQADRVQLQQVVLNLILNAVEAMGLVEVGDRELVISTGQGDTGVLVAVRDTGPGIDPTHRERVFEPFFTTKSSGVGMGLSICRSIIDAHGGRLWADANAPRGAVVQFTLPGAEPSS